MRIRFVIGIHPFIRSPTLLSNWHGRYIGIIDDRAGIFSFDKPMNTMVSIGSHEIKISHSRKGSRGIRNSPPPSACVIKGIKRTKTIKMLGIFLDYSGTHILIQSRRGFTCKTFVKNFSKLMIANSFK